MKSFFYSSLVAVGMIAVAGAQSLYSIASPVGLEESVPLKFSTTLSVGYDDNVNAVPNGAIGKQESAYARIGVNARAANWDARTQYSYDVTLGGIFYFKSMKFGTQDVMSDSTLRASLVHNFDSTLRYSASLGLSYMPEPDYSAGINVSSRAGEYFYAFFDNDISKSFDTRFSSTTGFSLATLIYNDSAAKIDNRDYYRLRQSFRYKWTARSAVSLSWKGEYADRRYGTDSVSNFVTAGWEYALTQYTNVSASVGPQFKYMSFTGTNASVYAELGLNHKLTDRSTLGFFFRREDEMTNTYQRGYNYGSNISYRTGISGSYQLNHLFTAFATISYVDNAYRRGQEGLMNRDCNTWNVSASLAYAATKNLSLRLNYSYTHGDNDFYYGSSSYNRNVYSISAHYTF